MFIPIIRTVCPYLLLLGIRIAYEYRIVPFNVIQGVKTIEVCSAALVIGRRAQAMESVLPIQ